MKLFAVMMAAVMASLVFPFEVNANAAVSVIQSDTGEIIYFAEVVIPQGADTSEIAGKRDLFEVWLRSEARGELRLPIDKPNTEIINEKGETSEFHYKVDFQTGNSETLVQFALEFANLYSFMKFNGINDLREVPKTTVAPLDYSLFVIWRTITIPNPYQRFFIAENAPNSHLIMKKFNDEFNGGRVVTENFYIFLSSSRRTEVNSDETVKTLSGYEYYFRVSEVNQKDVIIRDRFANTPIWYVLAVVATAGAMAAFYFILKSREKRKIIKAVTEKKAS